MNNYLLDTHTFLWFLSGDKQLYSTAINSILDTNSSNFISIASIWEIAIKLSIGKLKLKITLAQLKDEIIKNGFEILPLDFEHIIKLSSLENHHKDTFDRIIIAQAISEKLNIISKDNNFESYKNVKVIW